MLDVYSTYYKHMDGAERHAPHRRRAGSTNTINTYMMVFNTINTLECIFNTINTLEYNSNIPGPSQGEFIVGTG